MKKITLIFVLLTTCACIKSAFSQTAAMQHIGRNAGVQGMLLNPASIVNSNFKWDANIASGTVQIGMNYSHLFDSSPNYIVKPIVKTFNRYLDFKGVVNADIKGPSAMYSINKSISVGIFSRSRFLVVANNVGGHTKYNNADSMFRLEGLPNQHISINAWKELGVTGARTLYENDDYIVTQGISLKYLYHASNSYFEGINLSGTAFTGKNSYITKTKGNVLIGNSDNIDEKPVGKGFGTDIGFIIERKNSNNKVIKTTPYKYRLSISVLDLGQINYVADNNTMLDYKIHIPDTIKIATQNFENKTIKDIQTYLAKQPESFTNNNPKSKKYRSGLPTSAMFNLDYALRSNFFIDVAARVNLAGEGNLYSGFIPSRFTLTPRFETKHSAFYMPLSIDALSGMSIGFGLQLGPVFLSSNSLISNTLDKRNQIDFTAGLKFGFKKVSK